MSDPTIINRNSQLSLIKSLHVQSQGIRSCGNNRKEVSQCLRCWFSALLGQMENIVVHLPCPSSHGEVLALPSTSESALKPRLSARGPGASFEQRDQEAEAVRGPCLGGWDLGDISAWPQLVPATKQLSSSDGKTMQRLFSRGESCSWAAVHKG